MEANSERLVQALRRGGRSWLERGLLIHLLTIAIAMTPALLSVPVEAAEIGLFFTKGVTIEDRDTAKKAIAATMKYFETNYQLSLNCNLQIVLAKGDLVYGNAVIRYCVLPTKESAEQVAINSDGISCQKEGVEEIVIKMIDRSKADLIILVSHEIVHKFQLQESGNSFININWLSEGVADAIGSYVAESCGMGPVRLDQQTTCLKQLRAAKKFPSLTVLHSEKEFQAATKKYGINNPSMTAELATFQLAKLKGYKPLFQYFLYLKRYNNAQAFEMAFRMKLSEYENYFDQLLAQKL